MSGSAVIQNCKAVNSDGSGKAYGGGVSAANVREITLADSARIADCIAANGSGLYITGSQMYPADYGKLLANGGSVEGDVVLVFLLAITRFTAGSGDSMHIMRAESPGPQVNKLVPQTFHSAQIVYMIYIGHTRYIIDDGLNFTV